MGRLWAATETGLAAQAGGLFPWIAALFGLGIGIYFALATEPPLWALAASAAAGLAGLGLYRRAGFLAGVMVLLLALPALGLSVAGLRANLVATPLLEGRSYGPIEGRIVAIDRSASDKLRLTLDRVVLPWTAPGKTPRRVRVALHGDQRWLDPVPGATVILTGHLAPPSGPVEPGGFDFRRHAWFQGIGAVGYTRTPALVLEPAGHAAPVSRLRHAIAARIRAVLPGATGAVAAAVLTGERSGIGQDTLTALRQSNLAHLLAISGLHMGLLTGLVFAALRLGLVLIPGIGLAWPVKKIAAAGALVAAASYLALSGGNVATERAFVMVAVMLVAVLAGRRALSLRSVALAALVVLALTPEALLSPGFQMSFAATTALVWAFAAWRERGLEGRLPGWARGAAALVLSSAVAGAATAPFAMAHFNQVAHFGLLANLLAVPLMGVLVMPAGLVALLAMPLGLEAVPLRLMGLGLDWILFVAQTVAAWPGAVGPVVAPPPAVLPLIALAALVVVLWRGRGALFGLAPAALAVALWIGAERPWILIDREAALVGVMTGQGRALSRPKGAGFTARLWLENDGAREDQVLAAARWPATEPKIRHIFRKAQLEAFATCSTDEIVVSRYPLAADLPCEVFDAAMLAASGALAIRQGRDGLEVTSVAERAGDRLWSRPVH